MTQITLGRINGDYGQATTAEKKKYFVILR